MKNISNKLKILKLGRVITAPVTQRCPIDSVKLLHTERRFKQRLAWTALFRTEPSFGLFQFLMLVIVKISENPPPQKKKNIITL